MNSKNTSKKNISESTKALLGSLPTIDMITVSSNLFYGVFLSCAFLVSGLLFASGREIASTTIDMSGHVDIRQVLFENKVKKMVTGFPIEAMTTVIAEQDKTTAAFLVGIAKKESNWGKRVPRAEDGSDCFNYWGYRGAGSRGIAMGHGCFGSPEEAVGIVGGRLDTFVQEYKFRTPEEMVVWKCGWSCDGHSNQSVKKWIADVGYYTRKFDH